jgi:hypothetical protein
VGVVLVIVVGLVLVAIVGYYKWQREQKRRQLLLEWAVANNWTLQVEDDSLCSRWTRSPFDEGDHRRARNVLTGAWKGKPFVSFDYSYQTHSSDGRGGRSTTTHHFAVSAVQLPAYLPLLQVTPETMLSRLGNAVGLTDIELESEDFNRAFRVHANDPKFASDVLSPRTMELLLARPHFSWRVDGADILCWQSGEQEPVAVTAAVTTLLDVVAAIPSFVWHDHGSDAGSTALGGTS